MLRFFYRPDKLDSIEANLVAEASNRLGVGEFQFFRLAHAHWFGEVIAEERLEPAFLDYMLHDRVPHYARQYARVVIQRDDSNELDPEADEFHQFDQMGPQSRGMLAGALPVALVALAMALLIGLVVFSYTPTSSEYGRCVYPPCPWAQ
jgi:hypothetical protein